MAELVIKEQKKKIRQQLLKKLRTHKEESRLEKSLKIAKKLFASKEFLRARTILFYMSFDGEVETRAMIKGTLEKGKRVAIPMINKMNNEMILSLVDDLDGSLGCGPYGICQPKTEHIRPVSLESIDLAIVPGVAFDEAGNRLGRGKGYFDRFLSQLPKETPTIGFAFDFQVINDFPPLEPHDRSVTRILFA